jgi:hypothetical protein
MTSTQLSPDHFLVRRAEMVLWLSGIRECIELQAPPSVRKDQALRQLDQWLGDGLPNASLLMQ